MKKKSKKGQVYPAFVAIFTVIALTFAYVAISNSQEIKNLKGNDAVIGSKQAQIFYTLQDAESIKAFIDQAALNAAEKSFESMSMSCTLSSDPSENIGCGNYIYSSWSNETGFCAPDCEATLKGNFEEEFSKELLKYQLATGKKLPEKYNLEFKVWDDAFIMSGIASQNHILVSLPANVREQYSFSGAQLFEANPEEKQEKYISSLGAVLVQNYEIQPREAASQYSFTPSFSVRVNKKVEAPSPIKEWAEDTWDACTSDYRNCVDEKIDAFNKQNELYELYYANACDDQPHDLFFEAMEKIEDCASNGFTSCACSIDFSSYSYGEDLVIEIKEGTARLSRVEESLSGTKEVEISGASHVFSFANFTTDALPSKKIIFDFDQETSQLKSLKLIGLSPEASETILFEGSSVLYLAKLKDNNPLRNSMQLLGTYDGLLCPDSKDKFRFCAKVKDQNNNPGLFDIRFSLQMKKEQNNLECKDSNLQVIAQNEDPDKMVSEILKVKGFDYSQIISKIPIPGLQLLGVSISTADILSNLPSTEDATVKVMMTNLPSNLIGYEVYCGNKIPGINLPSEKSLVLMDKKISDIENSIKSSAKLSQSNPYYDTLVSSACSAPLAGIDGSVASAQVKRAIQNENVASFNMKSCEGSQIGLDKFQNNKYCITLIPIDSEGKSHPECKQTTCTEFNTLFDLALKSLLQTQFKDITLVPSNLIPESLNRYVTLPSNSDFIDAALGERTLDFDSMVDVEQMSSDIQYELKTAIISELKKEVTGTALSNAIDGLSTSKRQAVLAGIASEINDADAKNMFLKISSRNFDVRSEASSAIISRSIDKMEDQEVSTVIKAVVSGESPSSAAFNTIQKFSRQTFEKSTARGQREILLEASNKEPGTSIKENILKESQKKNCNAGSSDVKAQLDCLDEAQLNTVMMSSISTKSGQEAIAKASSSRLAPADARQALDEISKQASPKSVAASIISDQIDRMPDSVKKDIASEILLSGSPSEKLLQRELTSLLAQEDGRIDKLMKNANIKSLLEDELKKQLTSQLKLFKTASCELPSQS